MIDVQTIRQGDSFAVSASSIVDEFGASATNLATWDFVFTIKEKLTDDDASAKVTIHKAEMTVNNATGEVGLVVTPLQLADLTLYSVYRFALKAKTPSGYVATLDEGILIISGSARKTF